MPGCSERALDGYVKIESGRVEALFMFFEVVEIGSHDVLLLEEGPLDLVRGTGFEGDDQVDKGMEIGPVALSRMLLAIDVPAGLGKTGADRRLDIVRGFSRTRNP